MLQFLGDVAPSFLHGTVFFHLAHFVQYTFVALVLQEALDQFFTGVNLIATFIELFARQQHFGFDATQGSGHQDKFTGQIDIHALQVVQVI